MPSLRRSEIKNGPKELSLKKPTFWDAAQIRLLEKLPPKLYESIIHGKTRKALDRKLASMTGQRDFGLEELATFAKTSFLSPSHPSRSMMQYTHKHDGEVGFLYNIIIYELDKDGKLSSLGLPKEIGAIGYVTGLLHDIGKTCVPRGLLAKELGGETSIFHVHGTPLTNDERKFVGINHLWAGVEMLKNMNIPHADLIISNIGCHHVNYDGRDHHRSLTYHYVGEESELAGNDIKIGKMLPLHHRILKLSDLVSARLPRFYRDHPNNEEAENEMNNNEIDTLEKSVAYTLSVSDTDVDPFLLPYLLTGIYKISLNDARFLAEFARNLKKMPAFSDIKEHALSRQIISKVMSCGLFKEFIRMDNRENMKEYGRRLRLSNETTDAKIRNNYGFVARFEQTIQSM